MNKMSAEQWRVLRPALDELLELPDTQRDSWLAAMAATDAALATELRVFLDLQRRAQATHFLEGKVALGLDEVAGADLQGKCIGNYRLESLVGQGGMGTVWTANRHDGHFEGRVAIKLLSAAIREPAAVHRFMREGRLLARLSHPNIARLLDAGIAPDGTPFLVLEFVEGVTIDAYCQMHRLGVRERIHLFLGVLAAIEHSHTHLIVHRDVKSSNVLVTLDGAPKLLDFGIAGLTDDDSQPAAALGARTHTLWGRKAMTPQFAAPEQLQGQPVTTRTDVYAAGVLLYQLLTGRHPTGLCEVGSFAYLVPMLEGRLLRAGAALRVDTISPKERAAIASARSTTPDNLAHEFAGDLDNILSKALKTLPGKRYASASEFSLDLRRYLEHRPVLARPDTVAYRAAKFMRRNRVATGALAVATIAIAIGATVGIRNAREATVEAQRAAAINAFVRDMFGVGESRSSDPIELKSTTAVQLLDAGTARLRDDSSLSLEARVDLLGTLADMYIGLGQPASALPLLHQRLKLLDSPAIGRSLNDPELTVMTLLKISAAAGQAGLADERAAALDRAAPLARELEAAAPRIFAQWSYETSLRLVALDPAAAATSAHDAAVAYRIAGDRPNVVRSLSQQAFTLARTSNYVQARAAIEEATRIATALTPRDPELTAFVFATSSELEFQMLRLRSAEAKGRAGLAAIVEAKGRFHPMSVRTRTRLARTLWRRGELAACVSEGEAAVVAAESSGSDDRRVLPLALDVRGRCLSAYGRLDDAVVQFERVASLWDPKAGGGLPLGVAHLELSRLHLLRGELALAQTENDRMLAVMSPAALKRAGQDVAIGTAELRLAQGRGNEALQLLQPLVNASESASSVDWNRIDLAMAWAKALSAAADPRAAAAVQAARRLIASTSLEGETPLLEADLLAAEATQLQAGNPAAAIDRLRAALSLYEPRLYRESPTLIFLRSRIGQLRKVAAQGSVPAAGRIY
ncbi:MAG TPA: serine/threonine-protein kinase [Steroidobacteraceae bacterium]|jgi:serine/threonine-protein kinase|nr:serine/threonine-protein kinase [Steroidobacteraceae bacterium]